MSEITIMSENETKKSQKAARPGYRTYNNLKCTPIMLYPRSQEERNEIAAAAEADNRSLSNYILTTVLEHLRCRDRW